MTSTDRLSHYDAFFLDIDGVLIRGGEPLPGAADAFRCLQERGPVLLLTNNSSRSREVVAEHLTSLGFRVQPDDVVTSSANAAAYLSQHGGPATYWALGEEGIHVELQRAGHRQAATPEEADWVVVGIDRHLSYETLADALHALGAGAKLLATNADPTFPVPNRLLPGAGAMVGALRGMGFDVEAVVGKPSSFAYSQARALLQGRADRILMIGDRLDTDIDGGHAAGLDTALVLTGVTDRDQILRHAIQPTWIAEDLAALVEGHVEPRATETT